MQKHARLIAVVEALDNGKTIRETRDADVPIVARWLYHYAGWAQLAPKEMQGWQPVGVIGGIVPWNFPLMLLTWKVAPALAMGNTIVLKPATYTRLSALLFAEICAEAGLPPGVFNVLTGSGRMGSMIEHNDVDKVAFTGSTGIGALCAEAAGGKEDFARVGWKIPCRCFRHEDLDAVVEGLVNAVWFNQGQVCSAGSRLLVQEPIYEKLVKKVKERMKTLRLGHSLTSAATWGRSRYEPMERRFQHGSSRARGGGVVYQACNGGEPNTDTSDLFFPNTHHKRQFYLTIVKRKYLGPSFGGHFEPQEAIKLANNTRYGLGASVWTEHVSLALEVALSIKAGTVWVNGTTCSMQQAVLGATEEVGSAVTVAGGFLST